MVVNAPAPIMRAIAPDGSWLFGGGIADYNTLQEAVAEDCQTALQMFRGEAFWATTFGVDWRNLIGFYGTQQQIITQCTQVLSQRSGVLKVVSVTPVINSQTRALSIKYLLQTIYSKTLLSGSVSNLVFGS